MKQFLSMVMIIALMLTISSVAYGNAGRWEGAGTQNTNSTNTNDIAGCGTQIGDYTDGSIDEYGYSVSADEIEDYIEELLSDSESSFLYDDLRKMDFSEDDSFSESEKTTLKIAMGNQKIKIDALSDGDKIKSITSISYSQKADLDEIMNLSAGAILYHTDHSKIAREAAQDIIEKAGGSGRVTLSVDKSGGATENSVLISVLENK